MTGHDKAIEALCKADGRDLTMKVERHIEAKKYLPDVRCQFVQDGRERTFKKDVADRLESKGAVKRPGKTFGGFNFPEGFWDN